MDRRSVLRPEYPSLECRGEDLTVRLGDRDLYPGASPQDGARRKAEACRPAPGTLVLLCAPLLGYGTDTLLQNLGPDSLLVPVELDADLEEACAAPRQALDPRHPPVYRPGPQEGLDEFQRRLARTLAPHFGKLRRVMAVSLNGGRLPHSRDYEALARHLESALQWHWRNRSTELWHGRRWARNLAGNLGLAEALAWNPGDPQSKEGRASIFCAAGPSLDAVADRLAAGGPKGDLVCADTALAPLMARGLVPRAVVVVESQWHNLDDFVGAMPPGPLEVWADVWSYSPLNRWLYEEGKTLRFFMSDINPAWGLDRLATALGLPLVPALGSVGVTGLWLALAEGGSWGVAGTDFASRPLRPHARWSPAHRRGLADWSRLAPHPWLYRGFEGSDPVLASYGDLAREVLAASGTAVQDLRDGGLDLGLERGDLDRFMVAGPKLGPAAGSQGPGQPWEGPAVAERDGDSLDALLEVDPLSPGPGREAWKAWVLARPWYFAHFPDHPWPPERDEAWGRIRIWAVQLRGALRNPRRS